MLSLMAYVWLGLGVGPRLVYCIGSDGHSGIELAHGFSPCAASTDRSSASAVGAESCIDTPLLVQASKEQDKSSDLAQPSYAVFVSRVSDSFAAHLRASRGHSTPLVRERVNSLRTTVLRV